MRAAAFLAAVAALPLALAACDKADKGPKTLEEAKQEAKQLQRPEPGKYRQITKINTFEVPGAPPEVAAQMKKMMAGQGQETTFCLTKEDSEKGFEGMFKQVANGECRYDRFDATSGSIDALMVCKTGSGGTARMAMKGKVSKTGSQVKVDVEQSGEKQAGANAKIGMEVQSERIGDCDASTPPRPGAG
jgi:hypothetical protein